MFPSRIFPGVWYPYDRIPPLRHFRGRPIDPYVAQFTLFFLTMMTWAVVARSLLSWFPIDQASPLYQLLFRVTEPIIEPIRRVMPQTGMMDLSPMAAIIMLIVMSQLVVNLTAAA